MINVGIIGTGFGAKVHIPGFQKLHGVKVLALAGKNKNKTNLIAKRYNIPETYSDWRDLVKNPKIEVISIATPPHLHFPIIREALKRNKKILCEKPFCTTFQQARLLEKITKKTKTTTAVDFEFRYVPNFIELKKQLENKTIGKIRYCKIVWITGGRADENFPANWMNYKKFGGGVLLNYGSHVIDYLEWLLSPISSISADLKIIKKNTTKKSINIEDYCQFSSLLQNGILVQTTISNILYGGEGHTIEIYGSKGTLKLSNHNLFDPVRDFVLTKINNKDETKIIKTKSLPKNTDGRIFPFSQLAKDFIKAIEKKETFVPSFTTGIRVHKVIDAVRRSAQLKKWIKI